MTYTRRQFLESTSVLSTASLLGYSQSASAEPPPETKKIRLAESAVACAAPFYVAKELLIADGFTDVEYISGLTETGPAMLDRGRADFTLWDVGAIFPLLDEAKNLVTLAGIHSGCQEMFANERVQSIRDLKGKRIGISRKLNGDHIFVSSILAYVGIDPQRDVTWVAGPSALDATQLFIDGKIDAFMAFEPEPHQLREQKIGHTILNTTEDRPWSQYFCCMLSGSRDFVSRNPIATKRVLRALLKAADICALETERVARFMVNKGYEKRYEWAVEIIKNIPYRRWRDSNPEDTIRFHALRLHEVGMIKTPPNKLIARGTDWRFLNELKRELKA